jgi:hypothetical protein
MYNNKVRQEELANAVITTKSADQIVSRHEIPMSFDDYVKSKTITGLTKLQESISKAEEFLE